MKITKSQLKQIIKEEVNIMLEQQSEQDLERQAELEDDIIRRAYVDKYGASSGGAASARERKIIDMLSNLKSYGTDPDAKIYGMLEYLTELVKDLANKR